MVPDAGRRTLRRELQQLAEDHRSVTDIATIDLFADGGLVVEGPDEVPVTHRAAVVHQPQPEPARSAHVEHVVPAVAHGSTGQAPQSVGQVVQVSVVLHVPSPQRHCT